MRDWRTEIDEKIEEALFGKGDLSYDELKETIERGRYLGLKQAGKALARDVYIRHLKRLTEYGRIRSYQCKPVTSRRRRCYSLTKQTKKEKELNFSKTFNVYMLIILSELQSKPIVRYELNAERLEEFKRIGIDLSPQNLEEIRRTSNSLTTTIYYKPIGCVQVIEEQREYIYIDEDANAAIKKQLRTSNAQRMIGSMIVKPMTDSELQKMELVLSRYKGKKYEKFFRIFGFSKKQITEQSRHYYHNLPEDETVSEITSKVFLDLEKDHIIKIYEHLDKRPMYILDDDVSFLLDDCLVVKEEIRLIIQDWWKLVYPPNSKVKEWLLFDRPVKDVEQDIKFYLEEYQENSSHRIRHARELKDQTMQKIGRLKDIVHRLEVTHKQTIDKYKEHPLINYFVTICTNPPILQDFIDKLNMIK